MWFMGLLTALFAVAFIVILLGGMLLGAVLMAQCQQGPLKDQPDYSAEMAAKDGYPKDVA